jgi:hypothetical protein
VSAIGEIERKLEELDAFEAEWSTGSRKARRAALQQELYAAAEVELREEQQIRADLSDASLRLENLYAEAIAKLSVANDAFEAIHGARAEFDALWRRANARKLIGVPGWVARLSARMSSDKDVQTEIYRLRTWSGGDV